MNLSSGLVFKSLVSFLVAGGASTGTWILVEKGKLTSLDTDAMEGTDASWTWTVTENSSNITTGEKLKVEATLTGTKLKDQENKIWKCAIEGIIEKLSTTSSKFGITDQIKDLSTKTGLPNTNETSYTKPTDTSKISNLEKFFKNCSSHRSIFQWKNAKWGNKAESTINLKIIGSGTDENKYKFEGFENLYTSTENN